MGFSPSLRSSIYIYVFLSLYFSLSLSPPFLLSIQGQGFRSRLGLYLPKPVFSHGQLYVALSRAVNENNVQVLAETYSDQQTFITDAHGSRYLRTLNIVDARILGRSVIRAASQRSRATTPTSRALASQHHRPRRRLRKKTAIDEWELDAATESIPAMEDHVLPAASSVQYDTELDGMCAHGETDDPIQASCPFAAPLSADDPFQSAEAQVDFSEPLLISKDLLREDSRFRVRAKQGFVAVHPESSDDE